MARKLSKEHIKTKAYRERHGLKLVQVLLPADYREKPEKLSKLYTLARGDRRGFVALDYRCEVFAVSRWVSIRAKEVRNKLSNPDILPSVAGARQQIAQDMAAHLARL